MAEKREKMEGFELRIMNKVRRKKINDERHD